MTDRVFSTEQTDVAVDDGTRDRDARTCRPEEKKTKTAAH